jgi:hypothetical protein
MRYRSASAGVLRWRSARATTRRSIASTLTKKPPSRMAASLTALSVSAAPGIFA